MKSSFETLTLVDALANQLGLEYAEEFTETDIYFEIYRSSDETVVGKVDTIDELLEFMRNYR